MRSFLVMTSSEMILALDVATLKGQLWMGEKKRECTAIVLEIIAMQVWLCFIVVLNFL
jgi:hypothetical protein